MFLTEILNIDKYIKNNVLVRTSTRGKNLNRKCVNRLISISLLVLLFSLPIQNSEAETPPMPTPSAIYKDNIQQDTQSIDPNYVDIDKINSILDSIDENIIYTYLSDIVSFGPRMTSTYGCEKTAEYIYNTFNELGLDVRYQNWSSFGNRYNPRFFHGSNIEAILPGIDPNSDNLIIFNAHYDSVEVSPGADDDGSGVAAVLAAAYALHSYEFKHDIAFVCFSGEEVGLLGSQAYSKEAYENHRNILIEFNADMIGYANSKDAGNSFRMYGTQDINWFLDEIEEMSSQFNLFFDFDRRTISEDQRGGSDYASFTRYGYEAVAFFEGQWTPFYHTQYDDMSNVNISYLTKTSKLITMAIATIADKTVEYPFVHIVSPMKGKIYNQGQMIGNLGERKENQLRTILIDNMWVWAETPTDAQIEKVEFYYRGRLQFTDTESPYKWNLNKFSLFRHRIEVKAYDIYGHTASDWIDVWNINLRMRN